MISRLFPVIRTPKGVVRRYCIDNGHRWITTYGRDGARLSIQPCSRYRCRAHRVAPWYGPPPVYGGLPWMEEEVP